MQDLTFHANCLQWRQFAWNVRSCFLGKNKKTSYFLSSAVSAHRVVRVHGDEWGLVKLGLKLGFCLWFQRLAATCDCGRLFFLLFLSPSPPNSYTVDHSKAVFLPQLLCICYFVPLENWPRGYKTFFMLNSTTHEIVLLINLKLQTNAISLLLNIAEHEKFSANKYKNANYLWHFHIY